MAVAQGVEDRLICYHGVTIACPNPCTLVTKAIEYMILLEWSGHYPLGSALIGIQYIAMGNKTE